MMKKYIGIISWIIGAIIWGGMAWTYFLNGKTGLAIVQVIIAIHFLICGIKKYIDNKH